ncbi:hypothetical protein RHMOL_Rhmol13G0173000 [Rhododendron molle]|uniref:Uncharacterized protein n=1 Tax=Rhododendron molle TaxID=49168 RepID=A0ACC0L885_RHOML|nr:hypothetical protein RHMOL_Rhmol13G0173000 [Rhododendron molle]
MNSLFILQPVLDGMAIPDHDLSVCPFWVQIHGLPIGKMTRLGHDNRSCRFTPRNSSSDSGYGPNIRASAIRRSHIPIEVIRQEVDEEEERVTKLLGQRVAVQNLNGGARDPNPSDAREETSIPTQIPMEIVGVRPVVLRTPSDIIVKDSRAPPPRTKQGNIPKGIPTLLFPTTDRVQISSGPDSRTENIKPSSPPVVQAHSNSGPRPPSKPNQEPIYFITEPSDNPPSLNHKPNTHNQNQTPLHIEEIAPDIPKSITNLSITNPLLITSPSTLPSPDNALTTIFRNLAIKCKLEEELGVNMKSKLLCLCGPDPNPPLSNPISKSPAKRVSKPNASRIRKSPRKGGLSSTTVSFEESNSYLFDVPMQMLDIEPSLVLGNMATELKLDGRVAGPEQPPPQ